MFQNNEIKTEDGNDIKRLTRVSISVININNNAK